MNQLLSILQKLGSGAADDAIKYGSKLSSNELRDEAVNALADRISVGVGHPSGVGSRDIIRYSPMLYRAEDFQRTAARTAPEYQNVAVSTLDSAPLGFGGGNNDSHLSLLDPNLMDRPGQKALALEDTAWMPPRGMEPKLAQDRLFIGQFGAKKLKNRQDLRNAAWDIDNLDRISETGWMELNAPISNKDVILSGRKHVTFPDGQTGNLSSKDETENAILSYLSSGGSDRQEVLSRINNIFPSVAGVSVLGGLLGSSNQENI